MFSVEVISISSCYVVILYSAFKYGEGVVVVSSVGIIKCTCFTPDGEWYPLMWCTITFEIVLEDVDFEVGTEV